MALKRKELVIAGGGIAGHRIAYEMRDIANVTLVDPKSFFEVPMAMPRHLVEPGTLKSLIRYSVFLPDAARVTDRIVMVSHTSVTTENGRKIPFDLLVLATGADYRSALVKPHEGNTDDRMAHYRRLNDALLRARSVLIVGGGPIGVEIAGEITQERKRTKVTIVERESTLLPHADPVLQRWAADHLRKRGARILLGQSLIFPMIPPDEADFSGGRAVTDQREEIDYDLALWCLGARPNASYLMTHYPGSLDLGGYIRVAPNFLMSGTENIFAVGDVANLPVKGALWIDSQLKVLLPNLRAAIGGKRADSFAAYRPKLHPQTTIITLGRNGGLVRLPFGRSQWSPIARSLKADDMLVGRYRKAVGLHPTKD